MLMVFLRNPALLEAIYFHSPALEPLRFFVPFKGPQWVDELRTRSPVLTSL